MTKNTVSALINSMCPIWIPGFFLFANEPELDAGIDPGMALTLFPYSILDEMRFEPTTFRL